MLVDVHQHLWTEPLVEALEARREVPFVRRVSGLSMLHLAGERPYPIDMATEDPARRAKLVVGDGLDRAVIAISSPVGIEALPRSEASILLAAHAEGVLALPGEFAAWGPLALEQPDPADVDALLDRGFIGASLPAGELAEPDAWSALAPVLKRLEARGAPLFVHPGPGLRTARSAGPPSSHEPPWWSALTGYVSQMQAAWLAFAVELEGDFPTLRVVFAMLAGGAPLLTERLLARGGPDVQVRDDRLWYDCSSYGPVAVDAMAHRVGQEQLLYGSDRPVMEPPVTGIDQQLRANGAWLVDTRRSASD